MNRFSFNLRTHLWSVIHSLNADSVVLKQLWEHEPLFSQFALCKEEEVKEEEEQKGGISKQLKLKIDNFVRYIILTERVNTTDSEGDNIPMGALMSEEEGEDDKAFYLISKLIPFGLDINYVNNEYDPYYIRESDSLLHIALKKNYLPLVSLLLENDADIEYRNDKNKNALDIARETAGGDAIEILLQEHTSQKERPIKKRKL